MNFNQGWKFKREYVEEAIHPEYDTEKLKSWENVNIPHTLRLEKYCNSGVNGIYMGWGTYVKHFSIPTNDKDKKVFIRFEGVMGTTYVYVNGNKLSTKIASKTGNATMYGGFLPFVTDVTDFINFGKDNVITVCTDSRYDKEVPPGKNPNELDFSYFGGIYRDVTIDICDRIHITDANFEDIISGGGILADTEKANENEALIYVQSHIRNEYDEEKTVRLKTEIINNNNEVIFTNETSNTKIAANTDFTFKNRFEIKNPPLWSLENPQVVTIRSTVISENGEVKHQLYTNTGIRKIEMNKDYGLKINGVKAPILNGVNRHQEYAYIGYAAPKSLQIKDALKFKECGINVVRTAHYPASPDFLNACDELGILVIEPTPGWQFFNESETFGKRVMTDIRQMVRRDRNHPCILAYETVLNETRAAKGFTHKMAETAKSEYPSCKTATEKCVDEGEKDDISDIIYIDNCESDKAVVFRREYGDSFREQYTKENFFCRRVFRGKSDYSYYPCGEGAMFLQAVKRLTGNMNDTEYFCKKDAESSKSGGSSGNGRSYLANVKMFENNKNKDRKAFIGCTSWIGIDHNRTYAGDISACGLWDLMRLPKFSYYAMASQRAVKKEEYSDKYGILTGPILFIASYWTEKAPVLDKSNEEFDTIGTDTERIILVYSNVRTVKLNVVSENDEIIFSQTNGHKEGNDRELLNAPFEFTKVPYIKGSHLEAYGYDENEKCIAEHMVFTSKEPAKVEISPDLMGITPVSDGSDTLMLYGYITDEMGNICENADNYMKFTVVSGDAEIVGDKNKRIKANPCQAEGGIFGVYLRIGTTPSEITVKVESEGLKSSEITIKSAEPETKEYPYTFIEFDGECEEDEEEKSDVCEAKINYALNKPCFASSVTGNSEPAYAVDGKDSTVWIGNEVLKGENTEYFVVDLEENRMINGITLGLLNDSITYKYEVQISFDGENYKTVLENEKTGQASQVPDLFGGENGRYVKILFKEIGSDKARKQYPNAAITELTVF